MPVMIRNNDATELCITKGQEAVVVGWESSMGPFERPLLDTLFVRLLNPPQQINLPNLPTNVVPLTRASTRVLCTLMSGIKVVVQRQQVLVLPNFTMTDYASQGKTRDYNVIHLNHCRDHMSYYTCLSRSSSAEGTILMQAPDADKITKGISGYLRQEFRELNILDEVTRLQYEGLLPNGILHPLRNPTIRSYLLWNKSRSNEVDWHPALAYKRDEIRVKNIEKDGTWDLNLIVEPTNNRGKKCQLAAVESNPGSAKKDIKRVAQRAEIHLISSPHGLRWDSVNYSCAYDSIFTVLHSIWMRDTQLWRRRLGDISVNLTLLCKGFDRALNNEATLEEARNFVRDTLRRTDPLSYPENSMLTAISRVVEGIIPIRSASCGTSTLACDVCGYRQANPLMNFGEYIMLTSTGRFHDNSVDISPLSDVLGWQLNNRQRQSGRNCPNCQQRQNVSKLSVSIAFTRMPYLLMIEFSSPRYTIDHELCYMFNGSEFKYKLTGVIYGGQNHFVCRVIDANRVVWYHDGMTTGSQCARECALSDIVGNTSWLRSSEKNGDVKDALYAIYIRE